ncbi:hypothetical protein MYK68_18640 [Gordonia sp. PP30]|uniref:hypothetical protein n=1 Tax=Gordonia sp. PP30 TaxID=2935861 RepID=UPI001FFF3245|nr:hypothetical protein [Gordonia sp. PP30]UQE74703.1 hypothetical protein MYK68_18640 [Gordonia sp. PP30]
MNASKVYRCGRCQRRARRTLTGWNVTMRGGRPVGYLCPDCQTPDENAEAEINQATLTYLGAGADGRHRAVPKVSAS